ncbi:glycosyltransferase [Kineococcus sp. R8]|uniref:glycosyltransferase family 2 protein n=1 Tax=Kineococcus siccus TaxID=2696567 RepID=UPI001411F198|nr:glycosyltransferase family A protein [Kineococcus siccus]NAZ81107.1 glycosyltransferase [Kineococcus siccus]
METLLRAGRWPFLAPPSRDRVPGPAGPPTMTVVITAHQVAPFLPAAIESALAQTRPAQGVIVVDDGSTDDVAAAVAPYLDRVRVIHQDNGGEGAAKNTGARAASSEFVVILDGDDEMHPERLEALGDVLTTRPDLDILTTQFSEFGPAAHGGSWPPLETFPTTDQRSTLLRRNFLPAPALRREQLLRVGGFNTALRYGPDWECYLRMALHGSIAGIVAAPLYRYRRWDGQQTADLERVLDGRVHVLEITAATPGLAQEDRLVVQAALQSAKLDTLRLRLRDGGLERALAFEVARGRHLPRRSRVLALVAGVAPGVARRTEARRHPDGSFQQ